MVKAEWTEDVLSLRFLHQQKRGLRLLHCFTTAYTLAGREVML